MPSNDTYSKDRIRLRRDLQDSPAELSRSTLPTCHPNLPAPRRYQKRFIASQFCLCRPVINGLPFKHLRNRCLLSRVATDSAWHIRSHLFGALRALTTDSKR